MRSNDEIKKLTKEALQPLECVIEMHENDTVTVAIYPPNNDEIMLLDQEPLKMFRDGDGLFQILSHARKNIKRLGVELEPWHEGEF